MTLAKPSSETLDGFPPSTQEKLPNYLEPENKEERTPQVILDEALEEVGVGSFHRLLFVLSGMGWLTNNAWTQVIAVTAPRVQERFELSDSSIGFFSTALSAGLLIGAVSWGVIADKKGKRLAYLLYCGLTALFGSLVAVAPTYPLLLVSLFPLGFSLSGAVPVDGAFLAEFLPTSRRRMITVLAMFFALGDMIAFSLALSILPRIRCSVTGEDAMTACTLIQRNGWRVLVISLTTLQVCIFTARYLLLRVSESPVYYVSHGQYDKAADILVSMARRCGNTGELQIVNELRRLSPTGKDQEKGYGGKEMVEGELKAEPSTFRLLFTGRTQTLTSILTLGYSLALGIGYYTFLFYLPVFLERRAKASTVEMQAQGQQPSPDQAYTDLFIYACCGIPASLIGMVLADTRIGRKGSMALSMVVAAGLMGFFPQAREHMASLAAMSGMNCIVSIAYAVSGTYVTEAFSANIRSTAGGLWSACQRISGIIAPLVTGVIMAKGDKLPFYVGAGSLVLGGIITSLLPLETRPRKSKLSR
ncbi:major facilitator superfamily domain-containing protein [Piptocephalis cylindrospora]|uniref:Major facilitator superfamily domain-containing protein n=1 Tax=Piptocephalis cylindrospora TaxID=1907219 RepID=A0A4P9Y357_9FUNG|nr:major facilitator superfamily domain-containing protein [Piptocephalis cylindrospora]|eukprot:RKP13317.1 major facilitator superfamily domain-containing protein [Piptocephalis cylindrospora]